MKPMLTRFSLYGFLKNQQYYDPFIMLAFIDKGLSFFQIGILVGFREICVNIMEVPSGALADLFGRRKSMMLSFVGYIISFIVLGACANVFALAGAMLFYAIGDAFRTGTHKAIIFTWLRLEGRTDEKTRIYGYTRSWSKLGSALSVLIGAGIVLWFEDYSYAFYLCTIPYIAGLINFMGYPKALDGQPSGDVSLKSVMQHLREALTLTFRTRQLRRLVLESMGFEGFFKAAKDYLQPILKAVALGLPILVAQSGERRSAILIGLVYLPLYLVAAAASRQSHRISDAAGGDERGARMIWGGAVLLFGILLPAMFLQWQWVVILGFAALYMMQNLWRPILISRFDKYSSETQGATILSIESQAKSVATMIFAPILGFLVDILSGTGANPFWPIAAIGLVISAVAFLAPCFASRGHEE